MSKKNKIRVAIIAALLGITIILGVIVFTSTTSKEPNIVDIEPTPTPEVEEIQIKPTPSPKPNVDTTPTLGPTPTEEPIVANTPKSNKTHKEDPTDAFSLVVGDSQIGIAYGVDEATLDKSPGWMENSAFPGEEGVCVIYGHRNRNHLRALKNIEIGDVLTLKTANGNFTYTVETIEILDKNEALKVFGNLDPEYIVAFLKCPYVDAVINSVTYGVKMPRVGTETMTGLLVPIPTLPEQKRIVQKLGEMKPLTDRYSEAYIRAKELNQAFPELLKKSILQEAVQGKLVPQDSADEPASVLLERIRAEKEQLIKASKIKRDKHESVIFRRDNSHYEKLDGIERCIDGEIPFDIPKSWEWCRLGTILYKLTDGTHSRPKYVKFGVPFISVKDVSSGNLDFSNCKYISEEEHRELYKRCNPEQGDILLTKVGTTGIPIIVNITDEFSLFVSVALLKFNQELLYNEFLVHLINSPLIQRQAEENTRGVGNKNWVMRDIANTLIVIPPLSEQYRIVDELNKILSICDKL